MKAELLTTENHELFIQGLNQLVAKPGTSFQQSLDSFDDVAFTDNYVVTLKNSNTSPVMSVFMLEEFLSTSHAGSEGVLEFEATDTGLGSQMSLPQGARLARVQRAARSVYILAEKDTTKSLFRFCVDSRAVSSVVFGVGSLPAAALVDFMEYRGSIVVAYQDAVTSKIKVLKPPPGTISLSNLSLVENRRPR